MTHPEYMQHLLNVLREAGSLPAHQAAWLNHQYANLDGKPGTTVALPKVEAWTRPVNQAVNVAAEVERQVASAMAPIMAQLQALLGGAQVAQPTPAAVTAPSAVPTLPTPPAVVAGLYPSYPAPSLAPTQES